MKLSPLLFFSAYSTLALSAHLAHPSDSNAPGASNATDPTTAPAVLVKPFAAPLANLMAVTRATAGRHAVAGLLMVPGAG